MALICTGTEHIYRQKHSKHSAQKPRKYSTSKNLMDQQLNCQLANGEPMAISYFVKVHQMYMFMLSCVSVYLMARYKAIAQCVINTCNDTTGYL